ncbi:hypothetical protein C8Z91_05245 [Paenibacillus elgii]|uniref:PilZ domain-containing protein n=1 Tax=Paenibacillus elgii TaxID=189691 RepID=A0A2T6G7Z3_9BACL|nr:hypothetical protein [Paenibacillus elgii]PUA40256.1 hypothetical protein C8Z91_05245 [Paenibacillus elgii]
MITNDELADPAVEMDDPSFAGHALMTIKQLNRTPVITKFAPIRIIVMEEHRISFASALLLPLQTELVIGIELSTSDQVVALEGRVDGVNRMNDSELVYTMELHLEPETESAWRWLIKHVADCRKVRESYHFFEAPMGSAHIDIQL